MMETKSGFTMTEGKTPHGDEPAAGPASSSQAKSPRGDVASFPARMRRLATRLDKLGVTFEEFFDRMKKHSPEGASFDADELHAAFKEVFGQSVLSKPDARMIVEALDNVSLLPHIYRAFVDSRH